MTQSMKEQLLEKVLEKLEAVSPDVWEHPDDHNLGSLLVRRQYTYIIEDDGFQMYSLAKRKYGSSPILGARRDMIEYGLFVHLRQGCVLEHTEENPSDESRLARLYRTIDNYWTPMIPAFEQAKREAQLSALAKALGKKDGR